MNRSLLRLALGGVALGSALTAAEPQRFASGPNRVALVELYTSEGCSSCPPAERWIAARKNDAGLWRDFVPVSFHVDYWNRLGWTDRFSTKDFTQRQYALAEAWSAGNVYTPCFVRDGAEWPSAGERNLRPSGEKAGALTVTVDGATLRAEFAPVAAASGSRAKDEFEVHIALLGGGLVSKVTAGENSGETLKQEFVAVALTAQPLARATGDVAAYGAEFAWPATAVKNAPPRALAAWITRRGKFDVMQATGGWLAQ